MVRGIRRVTIERGIDPRDLALFAFGGAGPLHAVDLAAQLDMPRVIVPPSPGLLCAIGLLVSSWRHHEVATIDEDTATLSERALCAAMRRLEDGARAQAEADGVRQAEVALDAAVDLRYAGQGHQLTVPMGGAGLAGAVAAFHAAHRRSFGFSRTDHAVECVRPPGDGLRAPAVGGSSAASIRARGRSRGR